MKKPLALLLTAAMTFGMLTGCGSSDETANNSASSTTASETTTTTESSEATTEAEAPAEEAELSGKIVVASNRTGCTECICREVHERASRYHS